MSLHGTPEDHKADPPASWRVVKTYERCWQLCSSLPHAAVFETFTTRRDAEAAKIDGFAVRLWAKEERWYAGETVAGWRPWAEVLAARERNAAHWAAKAAASCR